MSSNSASRRDLAVSVRGLSKMYSGPSGYVQAIQNIDLDARPGEAIAIVGRSGSGKSTLVHALTGIDPADMGRVHVDDLDVTELDAASLRRWRLERVGIVFQFFHLLSVLTVVENVALPMDLLGKLRGPRVAQRAMELLEGLAIADQADKYPPQLSGGQQQRVAIARALANEPRLIVADEPTANLDEETASDVMQRLLAARNYGAALIVATHERDLLNRFDRVLSLKNGSFADHADPL